MRGFGSPQAFFPQQRQMNRIAQVLGIGMLDLQLKNLTFADGVDYRFDVPHGNARPRECLVRAAELIDYKQAVEEQEASKNNRYRIGIGIGVGAHGNGMFGVRTDISGMMLKMNDDGTCVLFTGSHDMGNASVTTQVQMVSEILGIDMGRIAYIAADTDATAYHLGDYSSRGTYVSGHAAAEVAKQMREKIVKYASELLAVDAQELSLHDDHVFASDGTCVTIGEVDDNTLILADIAEKATAQVIISTFPPKAPPIAGTMTRTRLIGRENMRERLMRTPKESCDEVYTVSLPVAS
jgi:CO/xanthine dehydrogenase Mo-binding subunit